MSDTRFGSSMFALPTLSTVRLWKVWGTRRDELGDLGRGDGHRLVDDDVLAGFENLAGDLEVGSAGGGHHEEVERAVRQHGFEGAVGGDAGIALGGIVRVALDDCGELEAFGGGDQRGVKDAPRHAKTYQTDSNYVIS